MPTKPRYNGPDPYTQPNATVYLFEQQLPDGLRAHRIYVDSDGAAWWRAASGMWHRFWVHPQDKVERD